MYAISLKTSACLACFIVIASCSGPIESALPPDESSPQSNTVTVSASRVLQTETLQVEQEQSLKTAQVQSPATKALPPAPRPAKIALSGQKPHFPVKRCINLGNALEAPNEGEWGYTVRVSELRQIARAGFDTVRMPVRWDSHMQSAPPYAVSRQHMERIKTIVSQAQSEGLGIIIDVHHYEDLINNPRGQEARFLALWGQIATVFQNAPHNVYFEVLNEPTNAMSMRELNQLYRKVIPLIRKTNPTRTLIIGGNNWNSVDTMGLVAWPLDKNIVATFHDYGPHEFTHQGAPWTSNNWPVGRKWGSQADMAEMQDTYDIAARFQTSRNVPILVGEFGVIDSVPQAERNTWIKSRRQFIEKAGYSWCAWDLAGAFKLYNTERGDWQPGVLDALFSQ